MEKHALDINLLATFKMLFEERSVSRSAIRLGVTQAAVSTQLAKLRKHYENQLFVFSGREMEPTAFACELAGPVDSLMRSADQLLAVRNSFDPRSTKRRFRIQAGEIETITLLSKVNLRLLQEAPGIQTAIAVSAPNLKHTDLAIVPVEMQVEEMLYANLYQDHYVCLVWRDCQEFGDTLSLEEYRKAVHILRRNPRNGTPDWIGRWLTRQGLRPNEGPMVEATANVPFLLEGTPYVATVLSRFAQLMASRFPLRILELPADVPVQNFLLQWYPSLNEDPAGMWLRDLIQEAARDIYGPVHEGFRYQGVLA
ncbi:LysR family transcriptional regulator [Pseudomonas sp. LRF_L74]|uniref:LysR family transcriptional regulator n=1 Tax=Pseudomonas sp. LRF_L74 TaxID=3369422 RepID=UPI003F64437B